jgi:hypothetical protein
VHVKDGCSQEWSKKARPAGLPFEHLLKLMKDVWSSRVSFFIKKIFERICTNEMNLFKLKFSL